MGTCPPRRFKVNLFRDLTTRKCCVQCGLVRVNGLKHLELIMYISNLLYLDRDGDASENQEQYASCSSLSTMVSLEIRGSSSPVIGRL